MDSSQPHEIQRDQDVAEDAIISLPLSSHGFLHQVQINQWLYRMMIFALVSGLVPAYGRTYNLPSCLDQS
jgi:hypothetical protein